MSRCATPDREGGLKCALREESLDPVASWDGKRKFPVNVSLFLTPEKWFPSICACTARKSCNFVHICCTRISSLVLLTSAPLTLDDSDEGVTFLPPRRRLWNAAKVPLFSRKFFLSNEFFKRIKGSANIPFREFIPSGAAFPKAKRSFQIELRSGSTPFSIMPPEVPVRKNQLIHRPRRVSILGSELMPFNPESWHFLQKLRDSLSMIAVNNSAGKTRARTRMGEGGGCPAS